jgi:hypothetical protein
LQLYPGELFYIAPSHKKPGQGRASTRIVVVSTKLLLSLLARFLVALLATLARLLCLLARFRRGPALLATLLTALVMLAALVQIVH